MKYSELPKEHQEYSLKLKMDKSPFQIDFNNACASAKTIKDLPRLIAPNYWAIELDSEEIREEVSTIDDLSLDTDYNYFVYHYSNYVFYEEMPPLKYLIITHEEWRRLIKPTLEKPIEQRVDEAIEESKKETTPKECFEFPTIKPSKPNKSDFYVLDKDAYIKALEDYIAIKG